MTRKKRLLLYVLGAGFALGLLGLLTIIGAYFYFAPSLPDAQSLKEVQLQVPLRVYTRDGRLMAQYGEQRRVPLTLDEIPDHLEKAVIAAEDDRFYSHPGIDPIGMLRAAVQNIRAGRIVGGASTITQQVARNFFLTFDQTWTRKIREIFLSIKIEQELSKNEILTLYLNKIYLGNRAYGFGAAAEIYYGKPLGELNLAQLAMLATLPKAPSRYNPIADPERALQRRGYVLGRMLELGYIEQAEYAAAMAEPVTAAYHGVVTEIEAPYLGELVRAEMVERFGEQAYTAGYRVVTTIDSRLQAAANAAMENALQEYDLRYGYRGPVSVLTAAELEEADPAEVLKDVPAPGRLIPALVLSVNEADATLFVRGQGETALPFAGMSWATPQLEGRATGPAPEKPADVLTAGDIIYIRHRAETGIRLAQIPEVQGALVSLDPVDGAVAALVGGYDFYASKFNRATQAQRQPGSSFKPFIYSAALANDFTPATVVNDAPVVFADEALESVWRPENDSGRFYGPTRLREALVRSRNLVSIRVLQAMGIPAAVNYISELGFPRDRLPRDLSLALGSAAFSPMEMARGYAVLANGGFLVEPYYVDRIEDVNGKVIFEADPLVACRECEKQLADVSPLGEAVLQAPQPDTREPEVRVNDTPLSADAAPASGTVETEPLPGLIERVDPPRYAERVMSPQVNYLIADMMRDVIRRGTGVRAMELGRTDLSGKTGTTNEYRDAWFSGFNPEIVTTVWVGFDDFTTLGRGEYGGRAALPAWIDFMRVALEGTPEVFPERPAGLVTVRIDPETGLLANSGNTEAIFETFIEGTLPEREPEGVVRQETGDEEDDKSSQDLF